MIKYLLIVILLHGTWAKCQLASIVWHGDTLYCVNPSTGYSVLLNKEQLTAENKALLFTNPTFTGAVVLPNGTVTWVRQALSGATATTNIVQTRTLADTVVVGGGASNPDAVTSAYGSYHLYSNGTSYFRLQ